MPANLLTPAERRLAALVFVLTLIGSAARVGRSVSPAVEAWLTEVSDTARVEPGSDPGLAGAVGDPETGDGAPVSPPPPVPEPDATTLQKPADAIDPNRAGYEALLQLPGVGPVLARRILDDRRRNGPYRSAEDLLRVSGIGPATLERLRPRLAVPGGAGPAG